MLPKEISFRFEYEQGKTWLHESLKAPFDFAILKTNEELDRERSLILQNSKPYFTIREKDARKKKEDFAIQILARKQSGIKGFEDSAAVAEQLKIGNDILDTLYRKGIIFLNSDFEKKPKDFTIVVVRNNIAEEAELNSFFTVKTAYAFALDRFSASPRLNKSVTGALISAAITPNLYHDEAMTKQLYMDQLENISPTRGMVRKDERVISQGELVDNQKYQILESLRNAYELKIGTHRNNLTIMTGQIILVTMAMLVLMFFLILFRQPEFQNNRKILLLMLLITSMVGLYSWASHANFFNLYLIPFCIIPMIVKAFFDTRIALFVHLVVILIVGFAAPNGFEFAFIQIVAGMVAIFSIVSLRKRSQLFVSAGLITLAYGFAYTGISLLHAENFYSVKWVSLWWFAGSGILTLIAYPIIYIFEKLFGIISDVSLLELADTNSPLLRQLALKAPGTFQHSMQVANLAESAIVQIRGNALLVRAGALYHDIGKMNIPRYFVENVITGANPHDDLPFEESAKIIISHVGQGVEIARKHQLPEPVIDFIRTHHGTTMVQYFYQSWLKNFPDQIPEEKSFRYPGPVPFSKETAVLMMADSVEAASRSLKHYDAETIEELVDHIIDKMIEQDQFLNSDITFRDIVRIKRIFRKMLQSVYHSRVEYPQI